MIESAGQWLYLTTASAADLQQYHRPGDLSVVHYAASASDKSIADVASGLLRSMGKSDSATGMRVHPSDGVNALPVWLAAHQTEVVVLSRVQSLQKPHILLDLTRLLAATTTTVVVATDPHIPSEVARTLQGMTPTTIPAAAVIELLPPHAPTPHPEKAVPDPIDIPACDWATFRYESSTTLSHADFAIIDAAYTSAVTNARQRLKEAPPTSVSTRELLNDLVLTSADAATATAAMRGTQAAYFEANFNLRIDPARLIAIHAHSRTPEFSDRDWASLRVYRDPERPAICSLYAHGLDPEQIKKFTIEDAHNALTSNRIDDHALTPQARPYLTANLIHRNLDQAANADPFVTLKSVRHVLNNAGRDTGILTAGKPVHTSAHTKANWKQGIGFLLKELK